MWGLFKMELSKIVDEMMNEVGSENFQKDVSKVVFHLAFELSESEERFNELLDIIIKGAKEVEKEVRRHRNDKRKAVE